MPLVHRHASVARLGRLAVALVLVATAAVPASAQSWYAQLSGTQEVPPNASPATGFALFSLGGLTLNKLTVSIQWSGLQANLMSGHIHCCALPGVNAGVALGFPGLPVATSGTYNNEFDLDFTNTYSAAFVAASGGTAASAKARLLSNMNSGATYVNLHTEAFAGGEIRGQIAVVPEPSTVALTAAGLAGLLAVARRRRASTRVS